MQTLFVLFIVAVAAIALFGLGMGLSIIFKGHYMQSEIGDNPHMQQQGIKCAAQQIRDEERALRGEEVCADLLGSSCGSCTVGSCTGGDPRDATS